MAKKGSKGKAAPVAVIADHVKDENNDGAAGIERVKLFLKRGGCSRAPGRTNPAGDWRMLSAERSPDLPAELAGR